MSKNKVILRIFDTFMSLKRVGDLPKDLFFVLLILLIGTGGFFLGRIYILEDERLNELKIVQFAQNEKDAMASGGTQSTSDAVKGMYVGSRSGTTYHLPWCSGAKRIKADNKIWFSDRSAAEKAGYRPAGNCKGI